MQVCCDIIFVNPSVANNDLSTFKNDVEVVVGGTAPVVLDKYVCNSFCFCNNVVKWLAVADADANKDIAGLEWIFHIPL